MMDINKLILLLNFGEPPPPWAYLTSPSSLIAAVFESAIFLDQSRGSNSNAANWIKLVLIHTLSIIQLILRLEAPLLR